MLWRCLNYRFAWQCFARVLLRLSRAAVTVTNYSILHSPTRIKPVKSGGAGSPSTCLAVLGPSISSKSCRHRRNSAASSFSLTIRKTSERPSSLSMFCPPRWEMCEIHVCRGWPDVLKGGLDINSIRRAGFELYTVARPANSVETEILLFAIDWRGRGFFTDTSHRGGSS